MQADWYLFFIPHIYRHLGLTYTDVQTILSRIGDPSPSNLDALIDVLLSDIGVHDTGIRTVLGVPTPPDTIDSLIDSIIADVSGIKGIGWDSSRDTLFELGRYVLHDTFIFPEATNLIVTLNSHVNADTWSAWTEIVDSGATTFTSKVDAIVHITSICVEDTSVADEMWMLEISYGSAYAVVARLRFVSGSIGILPAIQQFPIRGRHIPAGETVYYRLMCSAGNKNCQIHMRYYKHV